MLDEDDKREIKKLVTEAIFDEQEMHRKLNREFKLKEAAENPPETKLYLITLTGHQLAFPDDRGRAILVQSIYARATLRAKDPGFFGGSLQVIAYGDGKRLREPLTLVLTGGAVVGMVQVSEETLEL